MKRNVATLIFAASLFTAQSALALTEVITTIPAYWVERDGSLTLYGTANGPCGSAIFGVSKLLANYDEIYGAAMLAMTKGYTMDLVVETCNGTRNIVTFVKVCANGAYC